jgi:hypothetical protein
MDESFGNRGMPELFHVRPRFPEPSPHFSQAFYCGGGSGHVYCVALPRAPRRTVEYACGALSRAGWKAPDAPCIHARLRRLATKPCEKCGLEFSGLPPAPVPARPHSCIENRSDSPLKNRDCNQPDF